MTIKNKDGTVYKLSGPNPLMNDQSDWNKETIQIFNLFHKKETIKNTDIETKNVVSIATNISVSPREFINEIKEEKEETGLLNFPKEKISHFYCAPAIDKITHKHELYDNSYTTTKYGEKFIFEAIIVDQSDFQILFWCTKVISENSIVYRKIIDGGERWWKVEEIEEKSGGYLVKCTLSDLNPSFK